MVIKRGDLLTMLSRYWIIQKVKRIIIWASHLMEMPTMINSIRKTWRISMGFPKVPKVRGISIQMKNNIKVKIHQPNTLKATLVTKKLQFQTEEKF